MNIGSIICTLRKRNNILIDDLCRGLCSTATLSRIENEKYSFSLLLFEALMQRMGKSPDKYGYLVGNNEQEIYEMRKRISDIYQYAYEENGRRLVLDELEKLSGKLKEEDTINKQYVRKMRLIITGGREASKEDMDFKIEAVSEWLEVLRITVPDFGIGRISFYHLSLEELKIYFYIGIRYLDFHDIAASRRIFKEIIDYLEADYTDYEEQVKLYPQVAYQLALQYEETADYEDMLLVCTKGITLLNRFLYMNFLPELLHLKAAAMKALYKRDKQECRESKYKDYDRIEKQAACLDDIIKEYSSDGIDNEKIKQNDYRIIHDGLRNVYSVNDVIRRQRELKGMTQAELSEEICTPEHMSRIEKGVKTPNMRTYELIMQKLGQGRERYLPYIFVDDFEIMERERELTIHIAGFQFEEAEEIFLEILPYISEKILQNKQYIIMTKAIIDYGFKRISAQEKFEQCEIALRYTIPLYKRGQKDFVKTALSHNEITLLSNIASLHEELGELQYAADLLYEALESYRKLKTGAEYHIGNYTFLLTQYASYLGLLGHYETAMDKHKEVLKLGVQYGYGDYIDSSLYGISWNLLKLDEANNEACKRLCRQAYIVCDIIQNDYIKGYINKKYNEVFSEDIKV